MDVLPRDGARLLRTDKADEAPSDAVLRSEAWRSLA
jgi:hypothetical protein